MGGQPLAVACCSTSEGEGRMPAEGAKTSKVATALPWIFLQSRSR